MYFKAYKLCAVFPGGRVCKIAPTFCASDENACNYTKMRHLILRLPACEIDWCGVFERAFLCSAPNSHRCSLLAEGSIAPKSEANPHVVHTIKSADSVKMHGIERSFVDFPSPEMREFARKLAQNYSLFRAPFHPGFKVTMSCMLIQFSYTTLYNIISCSFNLQWDLLEGPLVWHQNCYLLEAQIVCRLPGRQFLLHAYLQGSMDSRGYHLSDCPP